MTIHEFGVNNGKIVILLHPALTMWDYFNILRPLLQDKYHIIIPALPGYDRNRPLDDFTSIEMIAADLIKWIKQNKIDCIHMLYGCDLGGSIALKLIATNTVKVKNVVLDGALTPLQKPYLAVEVNNTADWMILKMGKRSGIKAIQSALAIDNYCAMDQEYINSVLRFMTSRTIWRTVKSCNEFFMPNVVRPFTGKMEYWFSDREELNREHDLTYITRMYPTCSFIRFENVGHGGMPVIYPKETAERLIAMIESK